MTERHALSSTYVQAIIIGVTFVMLGISVGKWGSQLSSSPTLYDIFPILGIVAFILMAMHYVSGSLKRYAGLTHEESLLKRYFMITSYIVLVLILLHPGLLYIGLFQDGLGPPPLSSFAAYPDTAARAGLVMGSIALFAFLLFELRRWFQQKRWWKYVEYFNVAAMALIFMHSLILGGDLVSGWFRFVWIGFGWVVALAIIYNYTYDARTQKKEAL